MKYVVFAVIPFIFMSCFVSKSDYDKVVSENEQLKYEIDFLNGEIDELYEIINFNKTRLVNTIWQGNTVWNKRGRIAFGETSYTITVNNRNFTGFYKLEGDTITFNLGGSVVITGSLIGDNLTIGSDWDMSGRYTLVK